MSESRTAGYRRLGFWLVMGAAILWSTGGLIARLVDTDPWTTIFWRSVFCTAFLAAAVAIAQRGRWLQVIRETGWPGLMMAACFAVASTSFIMSLSRTSVANTLVIQSLSPFIAGLAAGSVSASGCAGARGSRWAWRSWARW